MISKIDFKKAKDILDSSPETVLLDVRSEDEYITGHAIGSILLPYTEIDEYTAAEWIPNNDTNILVYCRTGRRSAIAAQTLESLGYNNIYDLGALNGWPYGTT